MLGASAETPDHGRRTGAPTIDGAGATALSEGFTATKRQVNEVIREASRHFPDDEQIAFFCECGNERCCQAIWLIGPAYDQARAEPEWLALVPGHLATEDRAKAVVSSAGASHARAHRSAPRGANE